MPRERQKPARFRVSDVFFRPQAPIRLLEPWQQSLRFSTIARGRIPLGPIGRPHFAIVAFAHQHEGLPMHLLAPDRPSLIHWLLLAALCFGILISVINP